MVHHDLVYDDPDDDRFIMFETTYNGQGGVRFGFVVHTPTFDYYTSCDRKELDLFVRAHPDGLCYIGVDDKDPNKSNFTIRFDKNSQSDGVTIPNEYYTELCKSIAVAASDFDLMGGYTKIDTEIKYIKDPIVQRVLAVACLRNTYEEKKNYANSVKSCTLKT